MAYTPYQAIGISVYRRLGEPAKARLVQALGTVDEGIIIRTFADAYADYAVYRGEFGLVTNREVAIFMEDLFDEEKSKELLNPE